MELARIWILIIVTLWSFASHATDFKVSAPSDWKKTDKFGTSTLYEKAGSKSNERVVINAFPLEGPDANFQANLREQTAAIEEIRAELYERLGFSDYSIIDIERRELKKSKFKFMQVVRSRFRDYAGREVQQVERQFASETKLYVVTYMIDSPAPLGPTARDRELDWFQPVAPKREVAAAELTRNGGSVPSRVRSTPPAPKTDASAEAALQKRCEANVPDPSKRRKFGETTFQKVAGVATAPLRMAGGCAKGLLMAIPDFVIGTVKGLWSIGSGIVKYATNKSFRDQTNATVGAAWAQIKKDPAGFAEMAAQRIWDFLSTKTGDFFKCTNAQTQAHMVCETITMLNPRLLIMLATRAPLLVAEESAMMAAALKVIADESKVAGAARTAERADELSATVADRAAAKSARADKAMDDMNSLRRNQSRGSNTRPNDSLARDSVASKLRKDLRQIDREADVRAAEARGDVTRPSLTATSAWRAVEAKSGKLPKVWAVRLSKAQQEAFASRLVSDKPLAASYGRITQTFEDLAMSRREIIPAGLQDSYMTNLNRAIADLKPGETLNMDLYEQLAKDAARFKKGTPQAKAALRELKTQNEILRSVNARAGTSFVQKVDGFLADLSLRRKSISQSEVQVFKKCLVGSGKSVADSRTFHPWLSASRAFISDAYADGLAKTCLAIATRVLATDKTMSLATTDDLANAMMGIAREDMPGLLQDQSDVLAAAARTDIRGRAETYARMIDNRPRDRELRTFDTVIVGGGPESVAAAANLEDMRTLVINESHDMGVFSKFGDTFYINSGEDMAKASPNRLPGGKIQVRNLAKDRFPPGRVIGNTTEINLAMTDADFVLGERAISAAPAPAGSPAKYMVTTTSGKQYFANHVIDITGLGRRSFPFKDAPTLDLIEAEYASGSPRIRFVDDFMTDNQVVARKNELPLKRYQGKRVVVVGPGDGGAIASEYLLGHGPPAGYAYRTAEVTDEMLPKKVYWLGQKNMTSAEYKANTWERYHDLARDYDTGRLKPINGKAQRIEKITSGPDAGAFKVIYGEGPNDFVIADEVVGAAGYDQTGPRKMIASFGAEGTAETVDLQFVKGRADGFADDVNLAKRVHVNGKPEDIYIAGPAAGGLETMGEAGGMNSPRIEVLGGRTAALARDIKARVATPRKCITCGLPPQLTDLRVTQPGATRSFSTAIPMRVCVGCSIDKEVGIKFRLEHGLSRVRLPEDITLNLEIAVDPVNERLLLSSPNLDEAALRQVYEKVFKSDPELMKLIGTRVDARTPRKIVIRAEADDGVASANEIAFLDNYGAPAARIEPVAPPKPLTGTTDLSSVAEPAAVRTSGPPIESTIERQRISIPRNAPVRIIEPDAKKIQEIKRIAATIPGASRGISVENLIGALKKSGTQFDTGDFNWIRTEGRASISELSRGQTLPEFPGLKRASFMDSGPTPIKPLKVEGEARGSAFFKDDSRSTAIYGGNKVRKLEYYLGDASAKESTHLITTGNLGSNHAVATAALGREMGFKTVLVLNRQVATAIVEKNIRAAKALGAEIVYVEDRAAAVDKIVADLRLSGQKPYVIPGGGKSALGELGWVNAGLEFSDQVASGAVRAPGEIWIPSGTGGSASGLLVGLKMRGLPSRLKIVDVDGGATKASILKAAQETLDLLRTRMPVDPKLTLSEADFDLIQGSGAGFGVPSPSAKVEAFLKANPGLKTEDVFSNKAIGKFLDSKSTPEKPNLYWSTFNDVDLPQAPISEMPARIRRDMRPAFTSTSAQWMTRLGGAESKTHAAFVEGVAGSRVSGAELEMQARALNLPPNETTKLVERVRRTYTEVTDIRKAYGDALVVPQKQEAEMIGKIAELERRGVKRESIRARMEKGKTACPIR